VNTANCGANNHGQIATYQHTASLDYNVAALKQFSQYWEGKVRNLPPKLSLNLGGGGEKNQNWKWTKYSLPNIIIIENYFR
jgi:hypothetical protein